MNNGGTNFKWCEYEAFQWERSEVRGVYEGMDMADDVRKHPHLENIVLNPFEMVTNPIFRKGNFQEIMHFFNSYIAKP